MDILRTLDTYISCEESRARLISLEPITTVPHEYYLDTKDLALQFRINFCYEFIRQEEIDLQGFGRYLIQRVQDNGETREESELVDLSLFEGSYLETIFGMLAKFGIEQGTPLCNEITRQIIHWAVKIGCGDTYHNQEILGVSVHILREVTTVRRRWTWYENRITKVALRQSELEGVKMVPASNASIKKVLETVKIVKYNEEEEEQLNSSCSGMVVRGNCTICFEDFLSGSSVTQMPCNHEFHPDCIEGWLNQSHYCPLCRFQMPID